MAQWQTSSTILVTCFKGIAPVLANELRNLGFKDVREMHAGVEAQGSLEDCMRLNLHLRTGHRVLYQLKKFRSRNPDELYNIAMSMPWEAFFPQDGYFCIQSNVSTPTIRDTRFANVRLKDAVADRFKERTGIRPDSGPLTDGNVVFLHWRDEEATIYLDTTGEPLPKRGYRLMPHKAPLRESLAAAIVLSTKWNPKTPFLNPMCGSGTLAIEAALIASNTAPGLLREEFAFRLINDFDEKVWKDMRTQARKAMCEPEAPIIATDVDPNAIEAAKENAEESGMDLYINFGVCDFRKSPIERKPGVIVMNPEYGERLGNTDELKSVYEGMGDFFKQRCSGYVGYVFTGNHDLAKCVGLRTTRRIPFYNAKIECRLLEYELYRGTRKKIVS